jgi:MFS transporter, DHA3 family, tetracycline resistance protein
MKKGEDVNFVKRTKTLNYGLEFTHGVRRALMGALGILYFISLGYDVIAVTSLFAISTIIMTFFEFPTGAIADYDSRKKSIVISLFLLSLAFLGLFLFSNFWILAAFWILGDIAWTFSSGAGSAWILDALKYHKKKDKIVNLISRSYFSEKSGYVIGGLIGLVVVAISFSFVWLIVSVMNLVMMFLVIKYMEERNFKPEKIPRNYLSKALIKAKESFAYIFHKENKNTLNLISIGFLGTIAVSSFYIAIPLFFYEIFNLNPGYVSGLFSIVIGASLISPFLAEKVSKKKSLSFSIALTFLIMGISMFLISFSNSLILAIIFFIIMQLSLTASDVLADSALNHEFSSKIRASLGSLNNIVWALAFALASFLTGLGIVSLGLKNMIFISGVLTIISGLLYFFKLKNL